jgi:hypothetical protein
MYECRRLAQTGAYRADSRSPDWIGYAVAKVLKIDVNHNAQNNPEGQREDIARLKQILKTWFKNRVFDVQEREEGTQRKKKKFVVLGSWTDTEADAALEDTLIDEDDITLQ